MAILTLTTTTAATFSVYAPPVTKLYVIRNASAYDATIYNSTSPGNTIAAGLGVTIPAGRIVSVWSNGTNFYKSTTSVDLSTDAYGVLITPAGSVSAPAITTTGDLNTGIFYPAADTIAFSYGGVESMRINSSGKVGIGTDSPAENLHIQQTDFVAGVVQVLRLDHQALVTPSTGIGVGMEFATETAAGNTEVGATIEAISTDVTPASEDFDLVFKTMSAGATAAERMRIDSLGNLGIGGITTPLSRLDALTAGGSCIGTFRNGTTTAQVGVSGGNQAYFGSTTNHLTRLIQNGATQLQISTTGLVQMDNGFGSLATFYGCRAWVNFNGTTVTNPASMTGVRGSGNVSSVLDNGTGDYTINFTNLMPDTNYSVQAIINKSGNGQATDAANIVTPSTGSVRVECWWSNFSSGGQFDPTIVCVSVFR
jgi:hypothetical protein